MDNNREYFYSNSKITNSGLSKGATALFKGLNERKVPCKLIEVRRYGRN